MTNRDPLVASPDFLRDETLVDAGDEYAEIRADLTERLRVLEANHGKLDPCGEERGRLLRLRAALRSSDPTDEEPVEFGPPPERPDPTQRVEESET